MILVDPRIVRKYEFPYVLTVISPTQEIIQIDSILGSSFPCVTVLVESKFPNESQLRSNSDYEPLRSDMVLDLEINTDGGPLVKDCILYAILWIMKLRYYNCEIFRVMSRRPPVFFGKCELMQIWNGL
jgi:hypothetical protein